MTIVKVGYFGCECDILFESDKYISMYEGDIISYQGINYKVETVRKIMQDIERPGIHCVQYYVRKLDY